MSEQPISDNGTSVGNPTEVRTENNQQNQGKADETERETERKSDGLQNSRSDGQPTGHSFSETGSVFNGKQAAAYLKKDEKTIRNWITSGRIHAEKQKGSWQITKAELDSVFVDEQRKQERKTEQEKSDARSSESPDKQEQAQEDEQETKQEILAPTEVRSDSAGGVGDLSSEASAKVDSALVQQLKSHITDQEHRLDEKDMRLAETKAGFERQLNEKDERLNEKTDRINELKGDREQDRQMFTRFMNNTQELIHSLQTQVAQLEAPKQPVRSSVEAVEGDFTEEQGAGEQGIPGPKNDPLNSNSSNSVPSSPDSGEETKESETPELDFPSEGQRAKEGTGEQEQPKKGLFRRIFSSN